MKPEQLPHPGSAISLPQPQLLTPIYYLLARGHHLCNPYGVAYSHKIYDNKPDGCIKIEIEMSRPSEGYSLWEHITLDVHDLSRSLSIITTAIHSGLSRFLQRAVRLDELEQLFFPVIPGPRSEEPAPVAGHDPSDVDILEQIINQALSDIRVSLRNGSW